MLLELMQSRAYTDARSCCDGPCKYCFLSLTTHPVPLQLCTPAVHPHFRQRACNLVGKRPRVSHLANSLHMLNYALLSVIEIKAFTDFATISVSAPFVIMRAMTRPTQQLLLLLVTECLFTMGHSNFDLDREHASGEEPKYSTAAS